MRKNDIDYGVCALLYSMRNLHADRWRGFRSFLNLLYIYMAWLIWGNKYKALRKWINNRNLVDYTSTERSWGIDMNYANKWLDYAGLGYCVFVGLIITGILMRILHSDHFALILIPLMSLAIGWLGYVSCAISWKDRYLIYFRLFNHRKERWYEKWRTYTVLFTLGGILGLIGGIFCFFLIMTF